MIDSHFNPLFKKGTSPVMPDISEVIKNVMPEFLKYIVPTEEPPLTENQKKRLKKLVHSDEIFREDANELTHNFLSFHDFTNTCDRPQADVINYFLVSDSLATKLIDTDAVVNYDNDFGLSVWACFSSEELENDPDLLNIASKYFEA